MSFTKLSGKNSFEWKNDKFNRKKLHWSPSFDIDGNDVCIVYADPEIYSTSKNYLYQFRLLTTKDSIFPLSYTFSVVDSKGLDFFTSKGKMLENGNTTERMLMILDDSYLRKYNLIEAGTLTVRFTFNQEVDGRNSFGDLFFPTVASAWSDENGAVGTKVPLPPQTKENSTNTASAWSDENGAVGTKVPLPPQTKENSTNTEEEILSLQEKLLETLSNDFSKFYESKSQTDFILKVGEAKFPVHRAVLSARSPVFSAMFSHDTSENQSGEVDIPDVVSTTLSDVLYYIYSGKIHGLSANTAAAMYTVADKYSLIELRNECLSLLERSLTLENFCDAAVLAHLHGETKLEESVIHFIADSLEELSKNEKWKTLTNAKPLFTNKLLYSAFMTFKKDKCSKNFIRK